MTKELEELEQQFISNNDIEREDVKRLIEDIMRYCKIDKNGFVIILNQDIAISDKILLILSAKYLANKLQRILGKEPSISEKSDATELANMIRVKKPVVAARLKELKDRNQVISNEKGIYRILPHATKLVLNKLKEDERNE
jgi:DNA-binding transcriptional ArsR family regulator